MTSIFVTIPALSDPDLPATIDALVRMSSGRMPLTISVAEQVTEYGYAYALGANTPSHVRVIVRSHDLSLGPSGARWAAEQEYDGETHQLQVDAHVRCSSKWDEQLVDTADRHLAIITTLMHPDPWRDRGRLPVVDLSHLNDVGLPAGNVRSVPVPPAGAYEARTVIACLVAGGAWVDDVTADADVLFSGDEPLTAARLWMSGRRLVHAQLPIWQGFYRPAGRPWEEDGWFDRESRSWDRVLSLLRGDLVDDPIAQELRSRERSLEEWYRYSGIDYWRGEIAYPWGGWPAEHQSA